MNHVRQFLLLHGIRPSEAEVAQVLLIAYPAYGPSNQGEKQGHPEVLKKLGKNESERQKRIQLSKRIAGSTTEVDRR